MTAATLKVDFAKCIKAGECYYNHPDLFARTESAFPAIRVRNPESVGEVKAAGEAREVCPSGAITLE